ncbi:MAG: head-tail connector protein [Lachnospiraceae bacterium]|nr:head-tail connector protein [Lachnospiraceae bacterium]
MCLISLEEAKAYLRVDSSDEDALVGVLRSSACRLCADVARLDDDQWAVVNGQAVNFGMYTAEELARIRELMKTAILYTVGYFFEHREEADYHDLVMTLRNLLSAIREGVF